MKKVALLINLLFLTGNLFAQKMIFLKIPEFEVQVNYEVITDCSIYDWDKVSKKFVLTNFIANKGTIFDAEICKKEHGVNTLKFDQGKYIDTKDFKIAGNDIFPAGAVYSHVHAEENDRWVPIWYFDALKENNRMILGQIESKRGSWDGDITPGPWYEDIPQVSVFVLTNAGMMVLTPFNRQFNLKFSSLKKTSEKDFNVEAYPAIFNTDDDVFWQPNKENFPHLENGNPVKFRFEINGKVMKIYNGETGKICMTLIQMPAEWVKLYETFNRTGTIPAGLTLPEEYNELKGVKSAASPLTPTTSVSVKKLMTTNCSLKLRAAEATSTTCSESTFSSVPHLHVSVLKYDKVVTLDDILNLDEKKGTSENTYSWSINPVYVDPFNYETGWKGLVNK